MATEFKYTPDEFTKLVKAYHNEVEIKQNEFPDLAGLKNILNIENDEYEAMEADPAYHNTCLWAMRRRESFLNRAALKVKNTTGIKMLLAQPENGGYVEKPVDKTPRQIEVTLRGMVHDSDDDTDDCDGGDSDTDDLALRVSGSNDTAETGLSGGTSGKARRKPRSSKKRA